MKFYKKIAVIALAGLAMLLYAKVPVSAAVVLGPDVTNYIASRSNTVSVGVYDANTGQTYTYNPSQTYQTQSIVKMSILADVLYQKIPITSSENSLLTKMIENSDNSSASTLWRQLGGDQPVQTFFRYVGMNHTTAGTGGWWGRTTTTVLDQLTMMKYFAYPNTLLTDSQRQYGLNLMRNVQADQRWGTGYGPPSGVSIALKNGWVTTGSYVNSVGYINGQGKNYVIAVLTTNNKSLSYGIETINTISSLVWNALPGEGWGYSNGKWYFYKNGEKYTGWLSNGGHWYFLDNSGVMKTGWLYSGGVWYYLNNDGSMKTGWLYRNGSWYFLDSSGAMKTGWVSTGGSWYYLQSSGEMKTGWLLSDGTWYYLQSSGKMSTGWFLDKGTWYYLHSSGAMATGTVDVAGKKYIMSDSGAMYTGTGWRYIDGKWYYLKSSGELVTGWFLENGKWYHLNPSGAMITGWLNLAGRSYFLSESGAMVTGWKEISGKWYYFNRSGEMAANTFIQGYKLGQDGAWIQVNYVALGDSLAAGMTPKGQDRIPVNGVDLDWGYPNYIAENFKKSYQLLNFVNFGVSGYTTDDVIADLDKEAVQHEIKKATHLTIDIGANDLLPIIQANPSQAPAAIETVAGKINTILSKIDQLNPNVKVYVMGYYNPFPYVTDAQQKAQLDTVLQAFNGQIQAQAVQHGDMFVPTSQAINVSRFADYLPNPQNIHLSLLGYQVVAGEFWKAIQ